ncbi:cilia- and flagella-associated protein 47 [Otolemur garnettii]|uniref:cilia- and flagella-associated protein 47 n=1 Tax=Otolemur garnettii TaxID=30611 RepID=UPI000C7F6A14|nr:cilia- and flagella-associated protein 47 [Otolemur garnettii]
MENDRGSLTPRDAENQKKEVQLRVFPPEMKFLDTVAGKVYRLPITVHNLGRWSQRIRFQEPIKPQFKLLVSTLDRALASGLQMTAIVEYHPDKNENINDQLYITIGNKTLEIPIFGLIPVCKLDIDSEVNFGTLVANSKVYCKEITIVNHGKAPGTFNTEYQGQLPIIISPTSGIVAPESSTVIKVDFCADQPRIVNEKANVILQGRADLLLTICAHVVEQIIELLSKTSDKKLECIDFGSVFFGTSKIEHALLHNYSPEPMNWVAIMQDDSVGQELGTDIHQRTDIALNNLTHVRKMKTMDSTTFISCVPNEGSLQPYEKMLITFCFSPKLIADVKKKIDPSHRQDYAVFLRFETVGSKDRFSTDDNYKTTKSDRFKKVELALTGSGIPVLLQFEPGKILNFSPCVVGEHSELACIIKNQSKSLPVTYNFKKSAHFKIDPEKGKIDEGCIQNVLCSFIPHQIGVFKVKQVIELLGLVADENRQSALMKPFYHVYLEFNSICKPSIKNDRMKITPGMLLCTGQFVIKDLDTYKESAPIAMLQSNKTSLHTHQSNQWSRKDELIALPNDRSGSIRPGDHRKHFRTIFTKTPRYNYVDPDYAYNELEKMRNEIHDNYYTMYIKHLRSVRLKQEKERESMYPYNDTDIGLQPASGLKSPSPSETDIEEDLSSPDGLTPADELLSTSHITSKEKQSLRRRVHKELKSEPSTPEEKDHCSTILSPKQIHQVIVGPSVLNFGNICVNSTSDHPLHIVNMLPIHIVIHLDADLEELRKTNQFSYVIPPISSTYISIIFESATIGKFWKSFTFTVNNVPGGHILVMAVVRPVKLELSSDQLILRPQGFLMKTCFQGTIRLYNRQNCSAKFEWQPVNTERGIAFCIRPAHGTVEAYSSLECEVKWQPSFNAPEKGEFILHVLEGNTLTLKCVAHLGHTKVTFLEPRILFSNSPQGLTTWRKAVLHNVGQNHAYFQVCDQNLLPNISITPSQGIIPFGGITVLNISCTPMVPEKFDTRAKVDIRRANVIDLRIGGSVEIADIEINPDIFQFSGIYVGATHTIPFVITNKGITRARVGFNLEDFPDFSMDFKGKSGKFTDPTVPYIHALEIGENTSVEGGLVFSPKEVTTFDFTIQVQINFFDASQHFTENLSSPLTPRIAPLIRPCCVQAIVLRAPLLLSSNEFEFEIPLHEMEPKNKVGRNEFLAMENISKHDVQWTLDFKSTSRLFKEGIFRFSDLNGTLKPREKRAVSIIFCPNYPKKYAINIPIRLNDNPVCYRKLRLIGEVKSPKLLFDPPIVFFTPVPLNVTTVVDINILPENYFRNSGLHLQIPTARLLDGEEIYPFSMKFPKGKIITGAHSGVNDMIPCRLSFSSSKPVSFFTNLLFCDDRSNWFSLPVTATAENCLLTIYPYMAIHLDDYKITLNNDKNGSPLKTRDVLLSHQDARSPSPKKPSTSTKFCDLDPAKENLYIGMEIISENLGLDESETSKKDDSYVEKEEPNQQFFTPQDGTETYTFFEKVVNAAQTWFSLFGWAEGPHSLSIPESARRDVYKIQFYSSASSTKKISQHSDFSKYNKTIYDVLIHLCGKIPPGINSSQSLPMDNKERVLQLHWQHSSLLDFLSAQGGCVSHILPEFLLEPEDFKKWSEITCTNSPIPAGSKKTEKCSAAAEMADFEARSKRAWTDVFLQIYKVMVLSRVVPYGNSNMPPRSGLTTPKINPCFISSNIYSHSERILLSWLNTNYENTRHIIWKDCHRDIIPSEKWIVNFDTDLSDGLVLATQLGAYCPFLIETHFINMYTRPHCPEQYLHNGLVVLNAFREIGFDMNIEATDICDPNPIMMLMLCVYMYERLPTYLPKKVVPFNCTLHDTVMRQISLKNSSSRNIVYNAIIVGRDATDFSLSQSGNVVAISPKSQINLSLKFTSRFLHPAEASLILISKSKNAFGGTAMTFALKGEVVDFKAIEVIKCTSPCYQWKEFTVNVKNHFETDGNFRVILVESPTIVSLPSQLRDSEQYTDHDDSVGGNDSFHACSLKTSIKSNFVREFFSSSHNIYLETNETAILEMFFLPFNIHVRYCVIILSNKKIGELIYAVEGKGMIPLPSSFFPKETSSSSIDYSTSPDEGRVYMYPVLYLKCDIRQILDVELKFPLTNEAKERALAFAAQQQMSDIEYERRLITGTLESSSVRVAIALLGLSKIESLMLFSMSKMKKPKSISYITEVSLPEHFDIPKKINIPQIQEPQSKLTKSQRIKPAKYSDGFVPVPLRFAPLTPGRYPCKILMTSKYDVRVYQIEGVVNEEHPEASFEFETPAFECLTQNIPMENKTKKEWKCRVTIEGEWFYGPLILCVGPGETAQYPLTFKPIFECEVVGKLILQNEVDGMEHVFDIKGIGTKPLALEHIVVECTVGETADKPIMVPNHTNTILTFEVSSNLPIVWGNPRITVDPDNIVPYILHVCPWKRGVVKGAISFSVKNNQDDFQDEKNRKSSFQKTLRELVNDFHDEDSDDSTGSLRVWYSLEIHSSPGPPIKIIEMECVALNTICLEIPLTNPKNEVMHLEPQFTCEELSGYQKVTLNPLECTSYVIRYSPATTGYKNESIIFQPEADEEFWYLLKLTVDVPKPTILPELKCDLGKYVSQIIPLVNPTHETLELKETNDNPENFVMDSGRPSPLIITPHSTKELTIRFYPSMLGRADQQACINFQCSQFKEWKFYLSGVGLFPKPLKTERITASIELHSSIILPFKNPTKENVFVDVVLTSQHRPRHLVIDHCWDSFMEETSAFRLSTVNQMQGFELPPNGNVEIPVLFMPQIMKLHKTIAIVQMRRANRKKWPIDNFNELDVDTQRTLGIESGEIRSIYWMHPILGIPQAPFPRCPQAVIKCQSRKRAEENVEVTLYGDFFGEDPDADLTEFSVNPKRYKYKSYDGIHELPIKREFEYEIEFESETVKTSLESCIALYLIKKTCNVKDEAITMIFNVIFTPMKPMRSQIMLKIECIKDGVWKFPIMLVATDPDIDDVIDIEGIGLFKESAVDFRLTSHTGHSEPFTAYFLPGSDPEFFVRPQAGELLPFHTKGTLITVGFIPQMYSKTYKATLVVQTADMYWMYNINGLPQGSAPIMNVKPKVDTFNRKYNPKPPRRRNYIRENAKVVRTGTSSNNKGDNSTMK